MATTRRRAKAAPAPEPVETDDAFEELDDVDEAEEDEAPAPTRGRKAAKAAAAPAKASDELGSVWLAEHLTEVVGREFDSRSVRMLLRKAARDEDGPLAREIGEDRSRYTFKGPNDPIVKYIVKLAKAPRPVRAPKAVEEDEVQETPKPTRTRAAKTTAPAKATPAKATTRTRRRSTATEE